MELATPRGYIKRTVLAEACDMSPAEMRKLIAELKRQDVAEHPRHGIEVEAAFRCLRAVRGGL